MVRISLIDRRKSTGQTEEVIPGLPGMTSGFAIEKEEYRNSCFPRFKNSGIPAFRLYLAVS